LAPNLFLKVYRKGGFANIFADVDKFTPIKLPYLTFSIAVLSTFYYNDWGIILVP